MITTFVVRPFLCSLLYTPCVPQVQDHVIAGFPRESMEQPKVASSPWYSVRPLTFNVGGVKGVSTDKNTKHASHSHLFHTWATLTNKTRYFTRDRTPLASMAYISIILHLPLYSWSSWLYGIFFSLRIHSQRQIMLVLHTLLPVSILSSYSTYFELNNVNMKPQWLS